jgi:ubiquinone/menaquinone biosynthesis C-methylase UbiE
METPKAMGHYAIYDTVGKVLDSESRGRLLDIPAGEGALAVRLLEMGFDVSCCDLYPQIFKLEAIEIKGGDLDKTIPYADAEFDHVVCVEGLEHIENPANAIREFARVLKPNGMLIVSVPNIMNIEERLKWLFAGYTSHFKPLSSELRKEITEEYGGIEEVALHVNPIGYSELRFLLEKNGFELSRVHLDKPKRNSFFLRPIVGVIRLISRFSSPAKQSARWSTELNSNEVLLGGNTLIFESRKK